jgi:hypothetical protein
VIAVDTTVLARFYCDDPDDPEAARQRPRARRVMLKATAIFVPVTVVLELEWVTRRFYELPPKAFSDAIDHLLGIPHVTVERWEEAGRGEGRRGPAQTRPRLRRRVALGGQRRVHATGDVRRPPIRAPRQARGAIA